MGWGTSGGLYPIQSSLPHPSPHFPSDPSILPGCAPLLNVSLAFLLPSSPSLLLCGVPGTSHPTLSQNTFPDSLLRSADLCHLSPLPQSWGSSWPGEGCLAHQQPAWLTLEGSPVRGWCSPQQTHS